MTRRNSTRRPPPQFSVGVPVMVIGGIVGLALGYAVAYSVLGYDPLKVGGGTKERTVARAEKKPPKVRYVAPKLPDAEPRRLVPAVPASNHVARTEPVTTELRVLPSPSSSLPEVTLPAPQRPTPPPAVPSEAEPAVKPGLIPLVDEPPPTAKVLHDTFFDLANKLVDILLIDTVAAQDIEHKQMIESFNRRLRSKTIQFNFPVEDVSAIVNGLATVSLGTPAEAAIFLPSDGIRVTGLRAAPLRLPRWTEKKIAAIRRGDLLQLSGRPEILTRPTQHSGDIVALTVYLRLNDTDYHVHLREGYEVKHVRR